MVRTDVEYFDGWLNGQVFSVTSGTLRDVSTRIINTQLTLGANSNGSQDQLIITIPKGAYDWSQLAAGDNVLINGKDFGGTGVGDVDAVNFSKDSYDDVVATEVLGVNSLTVNQQGVPFNADNYVAVGYTGVATMRYILIQLTMARGSSQPLTWGFFPLITVLMNLTTSPIFRTCFLAAALQALGSAKCDPQLSS